MSKQDLFKVQSCVLKVNIHCDGCEQKVKKLLQKIDGVYSVKVDADEGKVVVTGDVDPAKVVKKLKRAGKHAEIWGGGQKGIMYNQNYPINPQFQNLQVHNAKGGKDNKSQNHKGQIGQPSHFQNTKGAQDLKEHKSVKFNLPLSEEEFDASDEEEEGLIGHGHPMHHNKMMPVMGDVHGSAKKGDVIDQSMKMKDNENGGKKSNQKGEIKKPKGSGGGDDNKKKKGKSNGGLLGRFLGFGKKSKKLELEEATYTDKSKKGGGNNKGKLEDHNKNEFLFHDNDDNTPPHKKNGKSGKGKEGQMGPGPIKDNYPMENIPTMNGDGGYYQGMQMQHATYNNNLQQANMNNNMYPTAMMYGMPHPYINYMPPPPMPSHPMADPITHTFSDENVESCRIM